MISAQNSPLRGQTGERHEQRHPVQLPARLITVASGLAGVTTRACRLMDISLGGASFFITHTIGLPDHYYLSIIGFEQRVGCAEIYRNGNRIGVRFIREIDRAFLSQILRADLLGPTA